MKTFEDMQVFGKEGFEAAVASSTALTKGLQAIAQAAHSAVCGAEDVQIVGGLEHMHHIPILGSVLQCFSKMEK